MSSDIFADATSLWIAHRSAVNLQIGVIYIAWRLKHRFATLARTCPTCKGARNDADD